MDNSLLRNKVTSIQVSPDRMLLVSGYKKGNIALWDLEKAKVIKIST
jgi:WD40 repeat protein